jgi:alanine racemase
MLCYVLDKNMISTNFVLMVKFTAIDEHELTALHKFHSNKIVIHLNHLKKNFQCIQKTKSKNTQIIGMIKSNAYGHGIVPVSSLLSNLQIDSFGVFTIEEGIQLREHNIQTPTLIFGSLLEPHMKALHQFHLTPVIGSFKELQVFLEDPTLDSLPFHLKVDTGMGRIGFLQSELTEVFRYIQDKEAKNRLKGICTHYADASDLSSDYTQWQSQNFEDVRKEIQGFIPEEPLLHTCNSAAFLRYPQYQYNAIRPGLLLYGISPFPKDQANWNPVLSVLSYVSVIRTLPKDSYISYNRTYKTKRPTKIAIIPIGYADGIPLSLSNRGWVLYKGNKYPIVGNVCMNQFAIDITSCEDAKVGDQVTIIGKEGEVEITAQDVATWANTIPYEIMCNLSTAIPRLVILESD